MTNYPAYCSKCDMITGHETHGLKTSCVKCGHTGKAPYMRWAMLPIIIITLAAIPIYIIATSILARYVLIGCVVLVGLILLYVRIRNSHYYNSVGIFISKCTTALRNVKTGLKPQ
jgi:hypothetical protein